MSRVMGTEGIRPRQRGIREEAALWPVQQGLQFSALRDGGDEKKKKESIYRSRPCPEPRIKYPEVGKSPATLVSFADLVWMPLQSGAASVFGDC